MRRNAPANEWRTNVSLGGRAEPCRLDPEAERLALAAARAVGAELAGVDLVEDLDAGRLVVLEVNAVPGWRALSSVTGIDVAAAVLAALRDCRSMNDDAARHGHSRRDSLPLGRPARPDRLRARGDRPQAGQRAPVP